MLDAAYPQSLLTGSIAKNISDTKRCTNSSSELADKSTVSAIHLFGSEGTI